LSMLLGLRTLLHLLSERESNVGSSTNRQWGASGKWSGKTAWQEIG